MRFLVAGASGFLGSHLTADLRSAGHHVVTLSRSQRHGNAVWDPYGGRMDRALVEDADVVVNLAGSPTVGNPHSDKWARNLLTSRIATTSVLADAIADSERRPAFLAGNAIAWFGDHGSEPVTESSGSRGESFLTEVTRQWRDAAQPAVDAGARVCFLHTTPVLDRTSAPLKQLLLLFKAGLGGRVGSGEQYFPNISLRDWVGAAAFVATHADMSGPVILSSPVTPTNAELTRSLARLVHRPAFLPVPAQVLKPAAGRLAPELLGSIRAVPQALLDAGFAFADRDVDAVLATGVEGRGVPSGA